MRRILITAGIQKIAEDYADNLFRSRRDDFRSPKENLQLLESEIRKYKSHWNPNWQAYADYLKTIRENFREILLLHPSQFDRYKRSKFSMLSDRDLTDTTLRGGNGKISFADKVVECMRYDQVREKEILPYIEKLGIKTCVYCNAQYAATVLINGRDIKGVYELDHFKPKCFYPFLCISFFNLQPCCSNCNKWKSQNKSLFNLYTDDDTLVDTFKFILTSVSIVKYMLYQDASCLDIKLISKDPNLQKNHVELFHTEELYSAFKDSAEEVIWKYKIYNDEFISQLETSFNSVFPLKKPDVDRFLYGMYTRRTDVYKRPLTKMMQDIAIQLKVIK